MSDDPETIVRNYLSSFGKSPGEDLKIYAKYLAKDVQYFSGTTMIRSREECLDFVKRAVDAIGLASWYCTITNILSKGDTVMVERIDYQLDPDMKEVIQTPIMGIFKVRNGEIVEWRDYWDVRPVLEYGAAHRKNKGQDAHTWGDAIGGAAKAAETAHIAK